jgi:hypothetical protein
LHGDLMSARCGGSRVEIFAVRHLRGVRAWLLAPFFPLGLARRDVAGYLRRFLSEVEAEGREAKPARWAQGRGSGNVSGDIPALQALWARELCVLRS